MNFHYSSTYEQGNEYRCSIADSLFPWDGAPKTTPGNPETQHGFGGKEPRQDNAYRISRRAQGRNFPGAYGCPWGDHPGQSAPTDNTA
jgi:hypothetical protein